MQKLVLLLLAIYRVCAAEERLQESHGLRGTEGARKLQLFPVDANSQTWNWPTPTALEIGVMTASSTLVTRTSSVTYTEMRIIGPIQSSFGLQHAAARVKLVQAGTQRTACGSSTYDVAANPVRVGNTLTPSDLAKGTTMDLDNSQGYYLEASNKKIIFMNGGQYQLCYAPDGTMLDGDSDSYNGVVPAIINVLGLSYNCNTDGCLATQRWDCHFNYRSTSQPACILKVSGAGARSGWSVVEGSKSTVSWTTAWAPNTMSNGDFVAEHPNWCTDSEAESTKLKATTSGVDLVSGMATLPETNSITKSSFTVSVCYCPDYAAVGQAPCLVKEDFPQQFGHLYYWSLEICDTNSIDPMCLVRYLRVMPLQPFRVRVLCPPGLGCAGGATDNELKFVASSDANIQSWESSHPCRGTTQSSSAVWQTTLHGGDREDYKDFHPSSPPLLSLPINSAIDVCYCDSICNTSSNWLQVGTIRTPAYVAIAKANADAGGVETMRYVGKMGTMALYGGVNSEYAPVHPYDSPKFSSDSLVNFISYDRLIVRNGLTLEKLVGADRSIEANFQSNMDIECQAVPYQPNLISEFSSSGAYASHVAAPGVTGSQFLAFDGVSHDRMLTPLQAGMLAVCYCGSADRTTGTCSGPGAKWLFLDRLLILGPVGNQVWTASRGVIFGFTLDGWGLEGTDYIRITPAGSDCSAGATGPAGITSGILVGCPSEDGSSCEVPSEDTNIDLIAEGSSSTGVFVTAVATTVTRTTLTFSGDLTGHLANDDIISLSLSDIVVGGQQDIYWTPGEALDAQRLAGVLEFPDNNTDVPGPSKRLLGQKVALVDGQSNQVTIPVGWASDPGFTFEQHAGSWKKHNRLSTAKTTKAVSKQSDLVVCWSALNEGQRVYANAGVLNIIDPPPMASAKLSPTTIALGVVAPVVISFTTSLTSTGYATPEQTELIFRFSDLAKVLPKKVADRIPAGSVPGDFATSSSVAQSAALQSTCGQFLLEVWSNDDDGFPMPSGCYYTTQYRDKGSTQNWRDFVLVFENGNGLKHRCSQSGEYVACEYHVAMNAAILTSSTGISVIDIYTTCDNCAQLSRSLEYGSAMLDSSAQNVASASEMQLKADGFTLLDVDTDGVKTLASDTTLRFQLTGTAVASQEIVPGAQLRLYLWPLFAWNVVNATCVASCATTGDDTCGPATDCVTEGVVSGNLEGHQNILKLTMPSNMDPIVNLVSHTFTISDLVLPAAGWFPSRIGVQLTNSADQKPSYTTSDGFLYKVPDLGTSNGRILVSGRTSHGSKPFMYDTANSVMVRLVLGATLWSDASLKIKLPDGYDCSSTVGSTGAGAIPLSHPIYTIDENQDGRRDNAFTNIGTNAAEGQWSNAQAGACDYILSTDMVLFAGTVLVARIAVNNPSVALTSESSTNKWSFSLLGKGFSTATSQWDTGTSPFITNGAAIDLGPSLWASNLVVMTPLAPHAQSLQPENFAKGVIQKVRVFFKPSVSTGRLSYVVMDAPAGFNFKFGNVCEATDLESEYYATLSYPNKATERLDRIDSCVPLQWATTVGHNRARMHVTRGLVAGTWYGFALKVQNPTSYTSTMATSGWLVWTQNSEGSALEGSQDSSPMSLNLASSASQSWGIYDQSLVGMQISFPNATARPFSLQGSAIAVHFLGLTVPTTGSYTLRVIAPYGFQFKTNSDNSVNGFLPYTSGTTVNMLTSPTVNQNTELIWSALSFTSGAIYGFETQMTVPDRSSTTASNVFVVEFGYTETSLPERLQAVAIQAPVVEGLGNCAVDYIGNVLAYASNYLQFSIQTASPLSLGGGIVITANGDGFQIQCPALPMNTNGLPLGTGCDITNTPATIKLEAGTNGIPAGFYEFEFLATNPAAVASAYTWTFATYSNIQTDPPTLPVDKEAHAQGFTINARLDAAQLVSLVPAERLATGRNDRPDQTNALVFQFRIGGQSTPPATTMHLRAPAGFEFSEDCLSTVVTSKHSVFMGNASLLNSTYSEWPTSAIPTGCTGIGRQASLVLGSGLVNTALYAFRISVKNPTTTPARNLWSIEFAGMSSEPFQGFDVWTFANTEVRPASTARLLDTALDALPVAIRFRPQNDIPAGTGLIVLTAPSGFVFVPTMGTTCSVELAMIFSDEYKVFDNAELSCSVVATSELVLQIIGTRPVQAGQLYSLTVQTRNPSTLVSAGSWRLQSFLTNPQSNDNALDDVATVGYATTEALPSWTVINAQTISKGTHLVEISFAFSVGVDLELDDVLHILAPTGFTTLITNGCKDFAWTSAFTPDLIPFCPCSANIPNCALSFESNTTVSQNTAMPFKVSMHNPSNLPLLVENVWKIVHLRNGIEMASRVVASWFVQPQLSQVQILLTGNQKAVGSISTIQVIFMPINTAGAVNITALRPAGFDFGNAQVSSPHAIDSSNTQGATMVVKTQITFGQLVSLIITNVQLAPTGGHTGFDLLTMTNSSYGLASKLDEILDFQGGFRLPGRCAIQAGSLISQYAKAGSATYPVRSQFRPRVGERGWAQFTFSVSEPVSTGNVLKIISNGATGYELHAENLEFKTATMHVVNFSVTRPSVGQLQFVLQQDLSLGVSYHINFWTTPLGIGSSVWVFETEDGNTQYPTNTNDGSPFDFQPLQQVQFVVATVRAPPTAYIDVVLTLAAGTTISGFLQLILPENFNIVPGSCGTNCSYTSTTSFPGTIRLIVNMTDGAGNAPLINAPRQLRLQLPPISPADVGWNLNAYDSMGAITAWGHSTGFPLDPMRGVSIYYNALAGNQNMRVVIAFESRVVGGTEIVVKAPLYYRLYCRMEGALKQLALPGPPPNCRDYFASTDIYLAREVGVSLNGTYLGIAEYAFSVLGDLPLASNMAAALAVTGIDGAWSVVVRTNSTVVESIYGIPPLTITNASVSAPVLAWSNSEANEISVITIGFTVDAVVSNALAVLFVLPDRIWHNVASPSDFKILGNGFPAVVNENTLLTTEMYLLRLALTSGSPIPAGTYRFQFPVMLPREMPTQNLWHIALCSTTSCTRPDDPTLVVSFVLAGFNLGERSNAQYVADQATSRAARQLPQVWLALSTSLSMLMVTLAF